MIVNEPKKYIGDYGVDSVRAAYENRGKWYYYLVKEGLDQGLPLEFVRDAMREAGKFQYETRFKGMTEIDEFAGEFIPGLIPQCAIADQRKRCQQQKNKLRRERRFQPPNPIRHAAPPSLLHQAFQNHFYARRFTQGREQIPRAAQRQIQHQQSANHPQASFRVAFAQRHLDNRAQGTQRAKSGHQTHHPSVRLLI